MKRLFGKFSSVLSLGVVFTTNMVATAQQPTQPSNRTEPVYIADKQPLKNFDNAPAPHSLDPALQLARQSLVRFRDSVTDYTAVLAKRERINDQVGEYEFMFAKFRNRKIQNNAIVAPFSVYLMFLKPATIKGREVLFVENKNDGKLFAHEGGMKRMLGTHALEPNSWLAMQGQRYPITDIGIENLILKLIERGERDRAYGPCDVQFMQGAKVSGRSCTVLQVTHPEKVGPYDFHIAQVFIDDEIQIPVRYAAYSWPTSANAQPEILEEYTYQDLKINVGLKDEDFNVNNSTYMFHKR